MMPARSHLHAIADAAGRAFAWWGNGLRLALPSSLVTFVQGDTRVVHLDVDEAGRMRARLYASSFRTRVAAEAFVEDEGLVPADMRRLINGAARSRPVVLHVADAAILTRIVRLPTVALEDLRQAVRFGLSRWTPFSADDVVFDAAVIGVAGEQASIRLRIIPRTSLEPLAAQAQRAGLGVTRIAFGSGSVAYAVTGDERKHTSRAARIDAGLLVSAILLVMAIPILLHTRWSDERANLRAAVQSEVAYRTRQVALEIELSRLAGWRRAALVEKAKAIRLSSVVIDLAGALPDEILVHEFSWRGHRGQARLSGASDRIDAALASLRITQVERITEFTKGTFRAELVARDGPP